MSSEPPAKETGPDRSGRIRSKWFLAKRDRWNNPFALWFVIVLAVSIGPIVWELSTIHLENSVEEWLPEDDPERRVLAWFQREFEDDETIVITWDSSSWEDHRAIELSDQLSTQAAHEMGIHRLTTPRDVVDQIMSAGVSEESARQRLEGVLMGPAPNSPIVLLAHLRNSAATHEQIVQFVQQACLKVGIPASELHLAGGVVTSAALNDGVRTTQWNPSVPWWRILKRSPSIGSALVSVFLALILLRSLRLAAMVLSVSVFTAAVTTVLIPLCGGSMNMVLVVIPTLMTVLTLSGAIHLVNYWKHAFLTDPPGAVAVAQNIAARPCVLAVGTTAIGMLSLLTSDLTPVRHFGLLAAVGVVISAVMVLLGLPALLILWSPSQVSVSTADTRFWRWLATVIVRHQKVFNIACVAVTITAAAGLVRIRTETRLVRFFPEHSAVVRDHVFIEDNICGLIAIDVAVAFENIPDDPRSVFARAELIRSVEAQVKTLADVSGTLSFAEFCPRLQEPDANSSRMTRVVYSKAANEINRRLNSESGPSQELARRVQSTLDIPEAQHIPTIAAGTEVWRIKAYSSALTDTEFSRMTADIRRQVEVALEGHHDVKAFMTGTVPLFLRTQDAVLQSLIESFGLAFVLIVIILVIQLRGTASGVLAMLPNVAPIFLVFGLLSWVDLPVDIGSMVTASVALGIAIDGTVHLLTWFDQGIRRGYTREQAVVESLAHCGTAMWYTTAIICFGLLVLLAADLLLVSRFGWLMAALVFAALLGDVIYLPALLAGPLGHLIERRIHRELSVNNVEGSHDEADHRSAARD
ncbi:MAG: MMPL family transporter [Planctomycetaceae bacterium]